MNRVIVDLEAIDILDRVKDERYIPLEVTNNRKTYTMIIAIGLLILFTLISIAQIIQWTPLDNFVAFQDIQRNFNTWGTIIADYEALESNKINTLVPSMSNYTQVACIDYGTFFIPIMFSTYNDGSSNLLLPTAVRRGNGDGWMVTKSANTDPAAFQQCLYVGSEMSDSLITCGSDMYNKLGYGGYLNAGHWCNTARDLLYSFYKN